MEHMRAANCWEPNGAKCAGNKLELIWWPCFMVAIRRQFLAQFGTEFGTEFAIIWSQPQTLVPSGLNSDQIDTTAGLSRLPSLCQQCTDQSTGG